MMNSFTPHTPTRRKILHPAIQPFIKSLTTTQLDALEYWCQIELARLDRGPTGFEAFYTLIFDRPLPPHAKTEWLPAIQQAHTIDKDIIIEAFRGSAKTTTLTLAYTAFHIAHHPHHSHLLIQAGDASAKDNTAQIADLIEYNPAWKDIFPHIVPDKDVGWRSNGYEVKRTDMNYPEWRALCAQTKGKDPTFLGLGYRSSALIGKHPTGLLLIDNIHDEHNTRSARELDLVRTTLTSTILSTMNPETRLLVIGTPWVTNDILGYLKSTGRFTSIKTPIQREVSVGEDLDENPVFAPSPTSPVQSPSPTWPQRFSLESIQNIKQTVGSLEFSRMYLLDLEAAAGNHLQRDWLHKYPVSQIDPSWPVVMGVDYASTADKLNAKNRDYFTIAVGRARPNQEGIILVDGFRGHVSQGEAIHKLVQIAKIYPTTQIIGVESVGKGEEFLYLLLRETGLPIRAVHPGRKSKGIRFEIGMAPQFQERRALISDEDHPFIHAFVDEWVHWPKAPHDDTLDAVYWMLYVGLPHLAKKMDEKKSKSNNPFENLGRK